MNKFKTLVNISVCSWFVATTLMIFTWLRIVNYAFASVHYVIEDKFIYIGVLGGWLFVWLFYGALIFLAGWYVIGFIYRIKKDVLGEKDDA